MKTLKYPARIGTLQEMKEDREREEMKATPERSKGARMERAAMRAYLRRKKSKEPSDYDKSLIDEILDWLLARQKRYDRKAGGLGRT